MRHTKKLITLAGIAAFVTYWFYLPTYPVYPKSDHYDPDTQTFYNAEPQRAPINVASALWEMTFHEKDFHPKKPLPTVKPNWTELLTPAEQSRFMWFGHSTLLMRIGNQTIITDPLFGNSASPVPIMMHRFQPPVAEIEELPPIDVVLLSHSHYDHLEQESIEKLMKTQSHFVVSLGMGVILQKWGIDAARITELDWWQSTERNGVKYTALPARHDSSRGLFDHNKALWSGFLIEHKRGQNEERFYFHGDSAQGKHFDEIASRVGKIDIAFIENGQYDERWPNNHLFPEQTAQLAAKLQPTRFMPIHWGAYPLALHTWNEPVLKSVPMAKTLGVNTLTPLLGQVFDVNTKTEDWFTQE